MSATLKEKEKRKKENRQKANDDQNVSWDDAYNLDSFSENKNANVQNKSQLHNENSYDMWEVYKKKTK